MRGRFLGLIAFFAWSSLWASAEKRPLAGWWYADVPAWDLADEGLPFRFTVAIPSRRDVLTRVLLADEARWTASLGFAKVYDSYDHATGLFKNSGGPAALLSAGRQFRWGFPQWLGAFSPDLSIEFGANFATRPFPADGTRFNLKLITGLEWSIPPRDGPAWSVGLVWLHFSNANLFTRNAGYDGIVVRLGRTLRF